MKTRIKEWYLFDNSKGARSIRLKVTTQYGVQVKNGRKWQNCCEGKYPLIFKTRARAEKECSRVEAMLQSARSEGGRR